MDVPIDKWGKTQSYKHRKTKSFQAFEKMLLEAEIESIFMHFFAIKNVQKFLCKSYEAENEDGTAVYSKAIYCENCLTAFFSGSILL